MHGFGPRILHVLPREGPGLSTATIRARLQETDTKAPSLHTIRKHLARMDELGIVYGEGHRYWRLVDSVFDLPAPEVAA
jgi:repressor of nif and glnA expression